MTCIIDARLKTKKQLREALHNPEARKRFFITDPSIVNPRHFSIDDMPIGEDLVVTNHPKRSWFAQISRKSTTEWSLS